MRVRLNLIYEEDDPQHGSTEPHSVVLHFADGSEVELFHDRAQTDVPIEAFEPEHGTKTAPAQEGST